MLGDEAIEAAMFFLEAGADAGDARLVHRPGGDLHRDLVILSGIADIDGALDHGHPAGWPRR
jgi:hypothetical protein